MKDKYKWELYTWKPIKGTGIKIYKNDLLIYDMGIFKNKKKAIEIAGTLYLEYPNIEQKY